MTPRPSSTPPGGTRGARKPADARARVARHRARPARAPLRCGAPRAAYPQAGGAGCGGKGSCRSSRALQCEQPASSFDASPPCAQEALQSHGQRVALEGALVRARSTAAAGPLLREQVALLPRGTVTRSLPLGAPTSPAVWLRFSTAPEQPARLAAERRPRSGRSPRISPISPRISCWQRRSGALEAEDLPVSPRITPYLVLERRPRSGRRSRVVQPPALERTRPPPYSAVLRGIHCLCSPSHPHAGL